VIDGGVAAPAHAAVTVSEEASFSQMVTLARSPPAAENVPRHIDERGIVAHGGAAALRTTAPAAATIEHRLPSPRPTPAAVIPSVDVHSSRGCRPARGLSVVFPWVAAAAVAAAVAASYFLS
jgi:hypothetical protein